MKLFHFNFSDISKYYDLVCDEYFKIILIVDFEHFTRELRVRAIDEWNSFIQSSTRDKRL